MEQRSNLGFSWSCNIGYCPQTAQTPWHSREGTLHRAAQAMQKKKNTSNVNKRINIKFREASPNLFSAQIDFCNKDWIQFFFCILLLNEHSPFYTTKNCPIHQSTKINVLLSLKKRNSISNQQIDLLPCRSQKACQVDLGSLPEPWEWF